VLLSIISVVVRRMLDAVSVIVRHEMSKDVELLVLRHANTVLRRHVARLRYVPTDRLWLAALSRGKLIRRKPDYSARPGPGRPPTALAVKQLVIRMARENPAPLEKSSPQVTDTAEALL
jgi:hypothetical protein